MEDGIPDDWFKGHTSVDSTHEAQFMIAMPNSSSPLQQIVQNRTEVESTKNLTELVSTTVPQKHTEYQNTNELYKKFLKRMDIGHLLMMYTLKTPLYTVKIGHLKAEPIAMVK
jgi:hypothetical protein